MESFISRQLNVILILVFVDRIQKATESLKMFQPAAMASFEEFVLDTSKEELLLKELGFSGGEHEALAFTEPLRR